MPFDPEFQSVIKRCDTDSIELQLGRSDFLLGEPSSRCPFPMPGEDAKEWHRGWLAEHSVQIRAREEGERAHPYRSWASRATRKKRNPPTLETQLPTQQRRAATDTKQP